MSLGSDPACMGGLRQVLSQYVDTSSTHKAEGTTTDSSRHEAIQRIVSVLCPAGIDSQPQNALKEATSSSAANATAGRRSAFEGVPRDVAKDDCKITETKVALDAVENDAVGMKQHLVTDRTNAVNCILMMIGTDDVTPAQLAKSPQLRDLLSSVAKCPYKVSARRACWLPLMPCVPASRITIKTWTQVTMMTSPR